MNSEFSRGDPERSGALSPDADQGTGVDQEKLVGGSVDDESSGFGFVWVVFRELLFVFAPALVMAVVIHLFLAQATVVYGQSMEPVLHDQQRLIVEKVTYRLHEPQRGDIVVLTLPFMPEKLIKRVIGLPGETLEIRDGALYINGALLDEPYIYNNIRQNQPIRTINQNQYFVMGDNRGNSNDSRAFGSVDRETIIGRAWLRYWPLSQTIIF